MALKYQYNCTICEEVKEEWYKSGEAPEVIKCPDCGTDAKRIWGYAIADTWSARHTGRNWENKRNQQMKKEYKQIDPKDW